MRVEKKIAESLKELCIPQNILGYDYLKSAIAICVDEPNAIHNVTKGIYPAVAELHGTTPSKVERAIIHAIEQGCASVYTDTFCKYLSLAYIENHQKPNNSLFIAAVAEYIRLNSSEG